MYLLIHCALCTGVLRYWVGIAETIHFESYTSDKTVGSILKSHELNVNWD